LVNVPNVDRFFSSAPFSFREESSEINPQTIRASDDNLPPVAEIDYLAKDYASFRKLMLDHLSLLVPQWKERHVADLGVMLVEVMAYAADYLSYYQDAVATEAYLTTARRRRSLRRHARLLDYQVADGCNSRTWVHFELNSATEVQLEKGTRLLTGVHGFSTAIPSESFADALASDPIVFETMYKATLHPEHNRMNMYGWGASEFRLDEGATAAALDGSYPSLQAGDVLIFVETTWSDSLPEQQRCHVVRLSEQPSETSDPLFHKTLTGIRWHTADALTRPLLVSSSNPAQQSNARTVVFGNNVLADHGSTIPGGRGYEKLPPVLSAQRFQPTLKFTGLTLSVPFNKHEAQAHGADFALAQEPTEAFPAVRLYEVVDEPSEAHSFDDTDDETPWFVRRDLLNSSPFAHDFVVETEDDGTIYLRFGDGIYGARPTPGTGFEAAYRIGNGLAGNIGTEAIRHIVSDEELFTRVTNPLPAQGGTDPETLNQIRLNAPAAFTNQLHRCVVESDYVKVAENYKDVRTAVARISWTGSWQTVFIYVQRDGARPVTDEFRARLSAYMDAFRLIGKDIEISAPHYVPLEIELMVYVDSQHSQNAVRRKLREVFSNVRLAEGGSGFFYPGNFTFGQPLYLSRIIATAMNVAGVIRVDAEKFRRLEQQHAGDEELAAGQIDVGTIEIVRLDNDSEAPENGLIKFNLKGGQ
jgi:hypothetical protein